MFADPFAVLAPFRFVLPWVAIVLTGIVIGHLLVAGRAVIGRAVIPRLAIRLPGYGPLLLRLVIVRLSRSRVTFTYHPSTSQE